jgi:hypothetical protein
VDAALATIVVLVVRPAEASRDAVPAAGVVAFLAIKLRLSTLRQVLRPLVGLAWPPWRCAERALLLVATSAILATAIARPSDPAA